MSIDSSNINAGDPLKASQYNNLRGDVVNGDGHSHADTEGAPVRRVLFGLNADRANFTPQPGWVYVATDLPGVYACYTGTNWTEITEHARLHGTNAHHNESHAMDAAVHTAGATATGELVERTAGGWDGRAQGAGGGLDTDKVDGEHLSEFYHLVMGLGDNPYNAWGSQANANNVDNTRFRFNGRGRSAYKLSFFSSGGNSGDWCQLYNITDAAWVGGSAVASSAEGYAISGAFTLPDGEKEYRVRNWSVVENGGGSPINIKLTI